MKNMSTRLKHLLSILLFTFLLVFVPIQAASIENAKNWLVLEVNSGALTEEQNSSTNALALASQSAKQSALAMDELDSLDTQFLLTPFNISKEINATEYISAKILIFSLMGEDTSEFIEKLLSMQHKDGGFAQSLPYSSTVLDTALALESLSTINTKETGTAKAIDYLLTQQNSDGSWKTTQEDKVYTTAIVLRSLWLHRKEYSVQTAIDKAKTYLLVQQNADGSYGTETFETALVLRSIAPLEYDKANLQTTIDYLDTLQQASGSWEEDIYTTALVLQSLLLADKEVPNPDLAILKGIVVDGDTGIALSDIEVHLVSDENRTFTTSSDGKFFFEGLRNGSYALYIADSNYAPLQTTLNFSGNDIDLGTLRLNKNVNATISTLTGVIKDKQTGEPIEGAVITVGDKQSITDSMGAYTISSIEAGSYEVSISKAGYLQNERSVNIPANTILYYNTSLNTIDFTIEATVKGQVIDKNTTSPLAGVQVTLQGVSSQSIVTTANGTFSFSKLGQGDYTLTISKDGYRAVTSTIQVNETTIYDYGSIVLSPIDLADTSVTLQGTVTQTPENMPLEGVTISVGNHSATSDSLGKYTLAGLIAEDMNITASKDGYTSVLVQASPTEGSIVVFSPTMQKNDTNLSIFGTILDSNSSKPIENVKIEYIGDSNITVYTDANGYYVITPIISGDASLKYIKAGYSKISFNLHIATESLNISPALDILTQDNEDNNASIRARVVDLVTGTPLVNTLIILHGISENKTTTTDENGTFLLTEVKSYDINLTFEKEFYKVKKVPITLPKNIQFENITFKLSPSNLENNDTDLVIVELLNRTICNPFNYETKGTMLLQIKNNGLYQVTKPFVIAVYYDKNNNKLYDSGDTLIQKQTITDGLSSYGDRNITIGIDTLLPYRDAPMTIMIDFENSIFEDNEVNNIVTTIDTFVKGCE